MVTSKRKSSARLEVKELDDAIVVNFPDPTMLNTNTIQAVGEELMRLAERGSQSQLIVNFGNVDNCTSQTLSHLIACHQKLQDRGGQLILCNPTIAVREILKTTKLDQILHLRADEIPPSSGEEAAPDLPAERAFLTEAARQSGPKGMPVALCDPRLDRARRLVTALLGDLFVVHFTDLEALIRYCQTHVLPVIAMPLSWPALGPGKSAETDQPVLRFIRLHGQQTAIVVYADTEHLSIDAYSRALAAGGRHVVNEASPTFVDDLRQKLQRLVADHVSRVQEEEKLGALMAQHGMAGGSSALQEVFRRVIKASYLSDLPVLIVGETGTGKQRVAEAIHRLDPKRNEKPFLSINCSALSKNLAESELFGHSKGAFTGAGGDRLGWFRATDGGTLLLDEVGELDLELQPKLLRVLQERRLLPVGADYEHDVDVRIIAVTNRHLDQMVADGTFRRDLFQRLNVFRIQIPPLRERPEDIESQAHYFLESCQAGVQPQVTGFGPRVLEALRMLSWEGNTRQLENLIRETLAHKESGSLVQMEDLPRWVLEMLAARPQADVEADLPDSLVQQVCDQRLTLSEAMDELERRLVQKVLTQAGGNRTRTAAILGLTPRSIFNKIKKYQLDQP